MVKYIAILMAIFCIDIAIVNAIPDTPQCARAIKTTPYYHEAKVGSLPAGYINKGDTCPVVAVHVDTTGIPWFQFNINSSPVWSPAKYWKYISEIDTTAYAEGKQGDEDKKRRLRVLREHREWPRRIIRAVRFGRICLDMTGEQCIASWDKPEQKSSSFTIGLGKHAIWLFKDQSNIYTAVIIKNNRIIGWTFK